MEEQQFIVKIKPGNFGPLSANEIRRAIKGFLRDCDVKNFLDISISVKEKQFDAAE